MSDSDDDFELDFVNQATNKVKTNWSSKIIDTDLKDVTNTLTEESEEIPAKRKKGKSSSGFIDSPMVSKKVVPVDKSYNDSEDDEIAVKEKKERPEITLTPPGSPAASPETNKNARGTRRTKKTEQALKKLHKNKGSTAAIRMSHLNDLDSYEDNWRPSQIPSDDSFDLKIRWKMQWMRFTVKPHDRMSHVLNLVAKEAGLAAKDINIYKDETTGVPFPLEKTVKDLQLSVVSLLSARAKVVIVEDKGDGSGDGSIEVKLQTKDRRAQPVMVRIHLTDKMQTVIDKFCEQSNTDKEKVKVFFEGDQLNPEELASDLDLEGGECFDVHINDK